MIRDFASHITGNSNSWNVDAYYGEDFRHSRNETN